MLSLIKKWSLPVNTVSEGNSSEHWSKSRKRHKTQAYWIQYYLKEIHIYKNQPILVKLIRISSRKLDSHDNLPMAFKWIVDSIASIINPGLKAGRSDDSNLIEWKYDQEKGKKGIRIELYKKESE